MRTDVQIDVDEDGVYIQDTHGEIVCWIRDEWEEEPWIVPSIVNAVVIALTMGPDELRRTIQHPAEQNGHDYWRVGDKIRLLQSKSYAATHFDAGHKGEITHLRPGKFTALLRTEIQNTFGEPMKIAIAADFKWDDEGILFERVKG